MAHMQRQQKLDEVLMSVHNYNDPARLRRDVSTLLQSHNSLMPQYQTFQANGRSVSLFYLSGTLPCVIAGNTYNIPVTIYFDPPYPHQAPRCFVTPTSGMAVNQGHPNIGEGGIVHLPCLSNWGPHRSTLHEIVQSMIAAFSAKSPVYATTGAQPPPQQRPVQGYHGQQAPAVQATPTVQATPVVRAQPVASVTATTPSQPGSYITEQERTIRNLTEKAKERWPVIVGGIVEDINDQQKKKADLQEHVELVKAELQSLKEKTQSNKEKLIELEAAEKDLQAFVDANVGKKLNPDAPIDELDEESRNVLELLSEELAMEEYMLSLDELLENKKIDMDTFLGEVRDVSREQFKLKYQRKKASNAVRAAAGAQAIGSSPLPVPVAKVVAQQRVAVAA
jgi:ESCRT-I complex subunit TSG101